MVERWTCKYCDITINDDAPSRAAHEGGLRHKSAVERALRQTYKKAERDRRDAAIQAREIAKVERAAAGAGAGSSSSSKGAGSEHSAAGLKRKQRSEDAERPTGPKEWKPTDKFAAYTTAANLGLGEDPAEVRAREEAELRQKEGFASEWTTVVAEPHPALPPQPSSSRSAMAVPAVKPAPNAAAAAAAVDEDEELRGFKTKEKSAPRLDDADEDDADAAAPLEFKKRTKKRRI
ncbi:hypothetical protein OC835_006609 [Tilletia horrida]|nr:hypothetical protein OC835_006609 [Tilletia horrida]KAK0558145.1 hypothetical protein OC844_005383 [Tilletia horrida]